MHVEKKLAALGLVLPAEMRTPPGFRAAWRQVRVHGTRAIIAGHGPRLPDGSFAGPGGKIGSDLTVEQGYAAARATALAVLGDLSRELGDLDRITSWVRVFGMVNAAPGFVALPQVIDGFTDLIAELFGEAAAICPRSVAGMAELALNSPVIIEAEVEIRTDQ
jgi:hypothetical protein